jgi:acetylornithine/N-succinyldiaminopimelate aminotransferase
MPGFLAHVIEVGSYLQERLWKLVERWKFKQIRGKGLLWAVDLGGDIAAALRDAAFERGLIINAARPSILRLMPSLRVTAEEIDEAIAGLEESLTSVVAA